MKKRKFNEGGMTEDEVYSKPLAKASFKEAFAEARAAGDKTFEYMGKKYTTELASDKAKTKAKDEDERKRQADLVKNQKGAERVSPELDVLPVGKIVAGGAAAAAALKGMSTLGKRYAAKKAAEKATVDKAAKIKAGKDAAKKSRAESSGAMKGDVRGDELRYRTGGKVSSASKRADGCAIRGKTKA
jgi:hypothetical protein